MVSGIYSAGMGTLAMAGGKFSIPAWGGNCIDIADSDYGIRIC